MALEYNQVLLVYVGPIKLESLNNITKFYFNFCATYISPFATPFLVYPLCLLQSDDLNHVADQLWYVIGSIANPAIIWFYEHSWGVKPFHKWLRCKHKIKDSFATK